MSASKSKSLSISSRAWSILHSPMCSSEVSRLQSPKLALPLLRTIGPVLHGWPKLPPEAAHAELDVVYVKHLPAFWPLVPNTYAWHCGSIEHAILLDNSLFKGRQLKVMPKRVNVPNFKGGGKGRKGKGKGGFRGGGRRGGRRGRSFNYYY